MVYPLSKKQYSTRKSARLQQEPKAVPPSDTDRGWDFRIGKNGMIEHFRNSDGRVDAECARLNAVLSRFGSDYAMNNLEEIDGFFAALICSPDVAKPSEYLPEIWGRELADDEAFANRRELQDFLGLLFRHWNSIVRILQEEDVFGPLLFQDEEGTAHANEWARGFMRGVRLHHESCRELLDDEEHGGPLIPIMILAHEHDPDPEMRPYKDNIDVELREKLILGIAGAVTAIYRYFAPQRRMMTAGLGAERTAYGQAERKIGRNDPCPCGSGKKYKHCCGQAALNETV